MSAPVTYGWLCEKAALHAHQAISRTATTPFAAQSVARSWIGGYVRTLQAVQRQIWTVRNGAAQEPARQAARLSCDSQEVAVLAEALQDALAHPAVACAAQIRIHATMWDPVVAGLHASADLLATHYDPAGATGRGPQVQQVIESAEERERALTSAADLLTTVLAARDQLALRCAQTGLKWKNLERELPQVTGALDAARRVVAHRQRTLSTDWDRLTVANAPIDSIEPGLELAGRLARIRQHAWSTAIVERPSLADIKRIVVVQVRLHAWALLDPGCDRLPEATTDLAAAGAAWQRALRAFMPARGLEPGTELLKYDGARIAAILASEPKAPTARTRCGVDHGLRHSGEIAGELVDAVKRVGRAGQIYVRHERAGAEELKGQDLTSAMRGGYVAMASHDIDDVVSDLAQARAAGALPRGPKAYEGLMSPSRVPGRACGSGPHL